MKRGRDRPGAIVWLSGAIVGVPIAIAKLSGTGWATIGAAYAIWFGLLVLGALLLMSSPGRNRVGEALGWMMILPIFFTIPAIAILVMVLRIAGLP